MKKQYLNNSDLQIAMTEYNENMVKKSPIYTQTGDLVGKVAQVYDNEHGDGEQVYAVVADPTQNPNEVTEVTVLFRGSTGPDKLFSQHQDVLNDWVKNKFRKHMKVYKTSSIYAIL